MATYPQGGRNRREREKLTWQPEDFEELGQELRRRIGAEIREEAEEMEMLSALLRRRRESSIDVARQAMNRGARTTISTSGLTFAGLVSSVGQDYLQVTTANEVLECRAAKVVMAIEPARSGGKADRPDSSTFKARLAEMAEEKRSLRFLVDGIDPVEGVIDVVATDHIAIRGDRLVYIPLELLIGITWSR